MSIFRPEARNQHSETGQEGEGNDERGDGAAREKVKNRHETVTAKSDLRD